MKVLILTDGSKNIGFGHVVRCTIFYDRLLELGHQAQFVIFGDESVKSMLKTREYLIFDWHTKIDLVMQKFNDFSSIILDSLLINQTIVDKIVNSDKKLLSIDDFKRFKYHKSIILDWTIGVEKTNKHYHNINDNTLLLGCNNAIVRSPFFLSSSRKVDYKIRKIFLMLGGTDVHGITSQIIEGISNNEQLEKIFVIVGKSDFEHLTTRFSINNKIQIYTELDAREISNLMKLSDVAITAGGQTLYELAALNVPTIAVKVVENQEEDIVGWKQQGLVYASIDWDDVELANRINSILEELDDYFLKKKIIKKMKGIINKDNIDNIISYL